MSHHSESSLSRESSDLTSSQLHQSLADSIEEAVNKSNNCFAFIPEIIRESHSCMCNTRKLMSTLGRETIIRPTSCVDNCDSSIGKILPSDLSTNPTVATFPQEQISEVKSSSSTPSPSKLSPIQDGYQHLSSLESIRILMQTSSHEKSILSGQRHRPIVVIGSEGVGKSMLLSQVFTYCSDWLSANCDVIKVVRHIGQSPSSSYTSELIRSLCIDITLLYGFEMRTDIVYELSSLSLWFHDLLKLIETTCPTNDLVIVLDDLHLLKSLQTSTILGWLPWTLPPSVHLICSVSESADSVVSLLKSRIPSDNVIKLSPLESTSQILSMISCRLTYSQSIPIDQQSSLQEVHQESAKSSTETLLLPDSIWNLLSDHFNSIDLKDNQLTPLYVSLLTDSILKGLMVKPTTATTTTTTTSSTIMMTESSDKSNDNVTCKLELTDIPVNIEQIIDKIINDLKKTLSCSVIDRLLTYLSGTRYGLREEELIDLIGGDENNNISGQPEEQVKKDNLNENEDKKGYFDSLSETTSKSIWPEIKMKLTPFLKEYFILGRPYIHWSHRIICETVKSRYTVEPFDYKKIHSKLADAFLLGFNEVLANRDSQIDKSYLRSDLSSDMLREIDELWFHLLSCIDIYKLKANALLNIDFMMSAVQSSSISYYRSVLELVRGRIIDWEVDLLYHMTKQSVNIVSQNTDQLSIEILLWLRPFAAAIAESTSGLSVNTIGSKLMAKSPTDVNNHDNNKDNNNNSPACAPISRFFESKYLENLVRDTVNWCSRYPGPMLIPINSWLHLPLPMQVSVISCPFPITRATLTSDHQNLIFCNKKLLHFFNLASKTLIKSIEGHRETITCLDISSTGRYLVTGSEDTSVILWEIDTEGEIECNMRYRLGHHVAGVLCTAITHNEEFILSGSEIGAVCVVRLESGLLIGRLEHHRGMITCIKVNSDDDIFATGSTDCSVTIWSLDSFCVLNQIFLPKAILHMDISMDSTFLMLALEDNKVHIRSLITGSEVHILSEHQINSIVSYVKFAEDSSRAILGTGDGKLHIYDVHSAHLTQTLTSHQDMITSIISQPCDKYLLTCGTSKIIIWNFYARKKVESSLGVSSGPVSNLYATTSASIVNSSTNINANSSSSTANNVTNNEPNNNTNINLNNNNTNLNFNATTTTTSSINTNNSNYNVNNNDIINNSVNGNNNKVNLNASVNNNNNGNLIAPTNGSTAIVSSSTTTLNANLTNSRTIGRSSLTQSNRSGDQDSCKNISSRSSSLKVKKFEQHSDPITCVSVSRDGTYAVTGSRDFLVKVWNLSSGETHATLCGHSGSITCVTFSPNGFFCVSGSEDKSIRVWSLTLGLKVFIYTDHSSPLTSIFVSNDSRRILSVDTSGCHRLWKADTGNTLVSTVKTVNMVNMFGNTVFSVGGKNDNSLRYWSVYEPDLEKSVSHSEPITCYTCTYDGSTIITGSQDMSLKVWEVSTGKLTQVLVGHEEPISCVSSAPLIQSMVVSGSQDCNLIVWDTTTGNVTFTLTGHTATILSVQLSIDGRVAISAAEDNTIMAWNALETGQRIALVDIHHTISHIGLSLSLNQIVVQLKNNNLLPIIKFHNNPAKTMTLDLPLPGTPNEDKLSSHLKSFLTGANRKLVGRGNLKREQSFDSFCWDQLHRGVSIDDFRKISALQANTGSPMGSRDNLATAGIIWDGTGVTSSLTGNDRNYNRLLRLSNKPAGPKQKMLKKQQSMFAFFPEHSTPSTFTTTVPTPPVTALRVASSMVPTGLPLTASVQLSTVPTTELPTQLATTSSTGQNVTDPITHSPLVKPLTPKKLTHAQGRPPSRSQSLEEQQTESVSTKLQKQSKTFDPNVQEK